jgi:hypothetical protein
MRADNAGEGGILTLMSLAGRNTSAQNNLDAGDYGIDRRAAFSMVRW